MPSLFGVRQRDAGRQSESATWISGVVAGAGKLISSVFNSNDRSTSSSFSYSTDDADSTNNDECMVVSSKEPDEPKQDERRLESVKGFNQTSMAIISEIDSKDAIEQMIIQETFTRDEGLNLIKLIESRVVDAGNNVDIYKKLPEEITYPSGSSAFLELTPELRGSAVFEAKKWLENKRHALGSNVNSERPSNMLQYDSRCDEGSPIDVAKSYMHSRPPFSSPSLVSTPNYSGDTSKGLKRNYHTFQSHSTVDEIQRVRLKSTDLACKMAADNQIIQDSPSKLSGKAILGSGDPNTAQSTHETSSPTTLPSVLISSAEADSQIQDIAIPSTVAIQHDGNTLETPLTIEPPNLPPTDITTVTRGIETVAEIYNYSPSTMDDNSLRPNLRSSVRKKQSVPESSQQDGNSPIQGDGNELKTTTDGSSARLVKDSDDKTVKEKNKNADAIETSNSTKGGPRTRGARKLRVEKDPLYKPPQPSTSRGRVRKSAPKARGGKAK